MTNSDELGSHFEQEFEHWEKNRMYPPNHSGETMITVNDSHLMAVARAKTFVESGLVKSMSPRMIASVELDIQKLGEVFAYIRQQITEPGLPIQPEPIEVGDIGDKRGNCS